MHLYLYKHMDEFTATLDIWRILPTNYYTLYYALFSSNYTILRLVTIVSSLTKNALKACKIKHLRAFTRYIKNGQAETL